MKGRVILGEYSKEDGGRIRVVVWRDGSKEVLYYHSTPSGLAGPGGTLHNPESLKAHEQEWMEKNRRQTPDGTFFSFQSALQSKDWDGLVDLLSPEAMETTDKHFEELKKELDTPGTAMSLGMIGMTKKELEGVDSPQEFIALMFKKKFENNAAEVEMMKGAKIVKTRIDGDKAKISVKNGDWKETLSLIHIDGKWYLGNM